MLPVIAPRCVASNTLLVIRNIPEPADSKNISKLDGGFGVRGSGVGGRSRQAQVNGLLLPVFKKSLFVGARYAEGAMRREESLVDGKNTNNCDEAEK